MQILHSSVSLDVYITLVIIVVCEVTRSHSTATQNVIFLACSYDYRMTILDGANPLLYLLHAALAELSKKIILHSSVSLVILIHVIVSRKGV